MQISTGSSREEGASVVEKERVLQGSEEHPALDARPRFYPRLEGLLPLTLWLSLSLAAKFLLSEAAVLWGGEEGKRDSLTHQIPQALLSKCLWGPRPAARSTVHSRKALSAVLDSIPALPPAS